MGMSHPAEPKSETVKVVDRRRVNPDGTARTPTPAHGTPQPAAEAAPTPPHAGVEGDPRVPQLTAELEAARKRVDELARAYQALQQDGEEFKRRLTRERERQVDFDRGNNALLVIEAIDQLDLVLSAADDGPLTQGVRMVRDNLVRKLAEAGVERLELLGTPYDPNLAEAADTEIVATEAEDGQVTAVRRAGYRLKERVIRPAQVRVARYVQPASA